MRELITQDELKERLHYDAESGVFTWINLVSKRMFGKVAGSSHRQGYVIIRVKNRAYLAHRLAWLYVHGSFPIAGLEIDHIDLDKKNNAISNLRLATRSQNMMNLVVSPHSKSGVKGVTFRKDLNKYASRIMANNKMVHLGHFRTIDEAREAYENAAKLYHGEYSNTSVRVASE